MKMFMEMVFAKFVPVGKGPVFYGSHDNQLNNLLYG